MNVVVTVEYRYERTPDGSVWTHGMNSYDFWTRYLTVFDGVKVVARVRDVPVAQSGWCRANGPGVEVVALPYYLGPWQYLQRAWQVRSALHNAVQQGDAVILRVASHLSNCLTPLLLRTGRPYGVEVVTDPYDILSPGAVHHPLRPAFRWWFTRRLQHQCLHASAAAYVTEQALQKRYPCRGESAGISDVELPDGALAARPKVFPADGQQDGHFRLVTVGSLAQMYKATDVLIGAVKCCVDAGLDVSLRIAGDGQHRQELEQLVSRLELTQRVSFLGQLPAGDAIREQLDLADLFILPSRQEGLPRAMVEAMARALPCIGSTVGGIPELVPAEDLVPAGDRQALARKIQEVLGDPARMSRMAARNLAKARGFRNEVLDRRRRTFFHHIRRATERWLSARPNRARLAEPESA